MIDFVFQLFGNIDPATALLLVLVLWRLDRRMIGIENRVATIEGVAKKQEI